MYMALDAIKEVSEAESRAELILEDAHKEARAIIAAAKVEGEKACDAAVAAAREETASNLKKQEEIGSSSEAKAKQKAVEECARLELQAGGRMDKAVIFIIDKVTNNQ